MITDVEEVSGESFPLTYCSRIGILVASNGESMLQAFETERDATFWLDGATQVIALYRTTAAKNIAGALAFVLPDDIDAFKEIGRVEEIEALVAHMMSTHAGRVQ